MDGTEYRVMLTRSGRHYVELTGLGALSCTTCDFASQRAARDWIDQDREQEAALNQRWQATSRRWPWWMHLWWRWRWPSVLAVPATRTAATGDNMSA